MEAEAQQAPPREGPASTAVVTPGPGPTPVVGTPVKDVAAAAVASGSSSLPTAPDPPPPAPSVAERGECSQAAPDLEAAPEKLAIARVTGMLTALPDHLVRYLAALLGRQGLSDTVYTRVGHCIKGLVDASPGYSLPLMLSELCGEVRQKGEWGGRIELAF